MRSVQLSWNALGVTTGATCGLGTPSGLDKLQFPDGEICIEISEHLRLIENGGRSNQLLGESLAIDDKLLYRIWIGFQTKAPVQMIASDIPSSHPPTNKYVETAKGWRAVGADDRVILIPRPNPTT